MRPKRGRSEEGETSRSSGDLLADRRYAYAQSLSAEGDHAAAADLFVQVLERVPDWAPGWFALGEAQTRANDRDGAIAAYRQAAVLDPDGLLGAPLALAALRAQPVPPAADPAYVRALFDEYAPRFERHLAEGLDYRGPALLLDAITRVAAAPARFACALDLGCGTGLMGALLRPHVEHLGGVDLSSAMIEQARRKNIYDELTVGDMQAALESAGPLDLAIAADVLVYVGDLGPICMQTARALRPGGLFAFTVQSAAQGLIVGADRRFAHSSDHIAARAAAAGLTIALCEPASTRRDGGTDVPGFVVVLRR